VSLRTTSQLRWDVVKNRVSRTPVLVQWCRTTAFNKHVRDSCLTHFPDIMVLCFAKIESINRSIRTETDDTALAALQLIY
jgi:hypothetical protein